MVDRPQNELAPPSQADVDLAAAWRKALDTPPLPKSSERSTRFVVIFPNC